MDNLTRVKKVANNFNNGCYEWIIIDGLTIYYRKSYTLVVDSWG